MNSPLAKVLALPILTLCLGMFWAFGEGPENQRQIIYPEHLVGPFTGGFCEETCHSCHFDYDLNWSEGSLGVSGFPEQIQPGTLYELSISVERESVGKAGFQLSARFADGSQAGSFDISGNERLMFTKQVPDSLQYVQHSAKGTSPVRPGMNQWKVNWESPKVISDTIFFNIAANAANGDASEFGDWIYVREIRGNAAE